MCVCVIYTVTRTASLLDSLLLEEVVVAVVEEVVVEERKLELEVAKANKE